MTFNTLIAFCKMPLKYDRIQYNTDMKYDVNVNATITI